MIDGTDGQRSRLESVQNVQEALEHIPAAVGLSPASPVFLLPYYSGLVPEDCGVSAFAFLQGGHICLHTFSFRRGYFLDLVSPQPFDETQMAELAEAAFGCRTTTINVMFRTPAAVRSTAPDVSSQFGPHLLLDFGDYESPTELGQVFDTFDRLPQLIGMTPIMRPYVIRGQIDGERVLSAMTMIAESHVSLHVFQDSRRAFFDLFSCQFFPASVVTDQITSVLKGWVVNKAVIGRGTKPDTCRGRAKEDRDRNMAWLRGLNQTLSTTSPVPGKEERP